MRGAGARPPAARPPEGVGLTVEVLRPLADRRGGHVLLAVHLGVLGKRGERRAAQLVCLVNEAAIEELALPKDPTGQPLLVNWPKATKEAMGLSQAQIDDPNFVEVVYPVVQGRVRAKQRQHADVDRRSVVLPLVMSPVGAPEPVIGRWSGRLARRPGEWPPAGCSPLAFSRRRAVSP